MNSDDGSIISVNGVEVLNRRDYCCDEWTSDVVRLEGGVHTVEYKYREWGGHAYAYLSWCGADQIIDQFQIRPDNLDSFGIFDTKHLEAIEAAGYDAAVAQMPAILQALDPSAR